MTMVRNDEDLELLQMEAAEKERDEWMAIHADTIAEELYQEWAEDMRDSGEDDSRDAYMVYLEGFFPAGC